MHRAHHTEKDGRHQDIPENNKNIEKGSLNKALGVPIIQKVSKDEVQKDLDSKKRANLSLNHKK